jgi:molybdopterin/thiamine biosynthesis adenylyltransferase/rhodanese-related sulfurtransferase
VTLTANEQDRYARHLILPEIGAAGQAKLSQSSVLIVGVGGLGSPVGLYLAAAGVGRIGLIDPDEVSLSNLQRQILYRTKDIGTPKILAAQKTLSEMNPEIRIEAHPERLSSRNALELLAQYDVIVDGTDNFETRYLINDACVVLGKAWVYGAVSGFDAQVGWFSAGEACYRCLYPENPDQGLILNCDRNGVLGVVPGLAGIIQATEVLKSILGLGESLSGKILFIDSLKMSFDPFSVSKRKDCFCSHPEKLGQGFQNVGLPTLRLSDWEKNYRGERNVLLLDVRSEVEFLSGHLPDARHVPLSDLDHFAEEIPSGTQVVVYCQGRTRSLRAFQILKSQGIERVYQLILSELIPKSSQL